MNQEEFEGLVKELIARLDASFTDLQKANDQGKIAINRISNQEIQIKVTKTGTYRIYAESNYVYLQSPLSGLYNYRWDAANQQWKSETQVHILEDLLMREFITLTKGTLQF